MSSLPRFVCLFNVKLRSIREVFNRAKRESCYQVRERGAQVTQDTQKRKLIKKKKDNKKSQQVPYMVRWGSASSLEQREWDQMPKFSLCQPIASRDMARDIWPCHRDACRWCISQLGSTLSSMKLWEWLQGGWVEVGEGGVRGRNTREKERGGEKRGWVLD